ncbi:MAG: DUF2264 domain-containing protein [Tepidisphaeraceae bacterium]
MRTPVLNPLKTRTDLQNAFLSLEEALLTHWRSDSSGPDLTLYRARYSEPITRLETVARYLWGLIPFTAGGGQSRGWSFVLDAIAHGTDPSHPEYWGAVEDFDQRSVEMAAFGVALRLVPEKIWTPLSAEQKDRFATWMQGVIAHDLFPNNWQFFRLLVGLGLRHIGRAPADLDAWEQKTIDLLDACYIGDGWYADGLNNQRDYYIAMAFHFYSLLLSHLAGAGPVLKRVEEWKSRATTFAKDFVYWFGADGSSIAFGRSLTYRFAVAGFWGGCALAGVPGFTPGQNKGMLLRNIRWWWKQPILYPDGILSLGYAYPNLNMLEPYNAMGSPYWAFKAFAPLMLPADDAFWTAAEEPLPDASPRRVQPKPAFITDRDPDSGHVIAHSAGQWYGAWALRHRDAKYAKFAYSSFFAPCVGANHEWLPGVGSDNTLSIIEGSTPAPGAFWQNRGLTTNARVEADHVVSDWNYVPGVDVRTWIVPGGAWHVRVHRVKTDRTIQVAEGGFAAPDPQVIAKQDHAVCLRGTDAGVSGLIDASANRKASLNAIEPNSSLGHSLVQAPIVVGTFDAGTHWLATMALGAAPGSKAAWEQPPTVELKAGASATIRFGKTNVILDLTT